MEYIKINKLKEENLSKTSEELFNVVEPVPYQCSKIDSVIKTLQQMEKESDVGKYDDDVEDLKNRLDSVNWEFSGLIDTIEELRTAIGDVRDWGNGWKKLCKKIIENENFDVSKYI